jgi:hypothetical protein
MAFANEHRNLGWYDTWEQNAQRTAVALDGDPSSGVVNRADPHADLIAAVGQPADAHQVLLGPTAAGFNLSAPRRNVAFLGAPRGSEPVRWKPKIRFPIA